MAEDTATNSQEETQEESQPAPSLMPDLIGQDYSEARRQLVAYNVQVVRVDRIAPESDGTVIDQSPKPGADFSQRVELTVSISAPAVPDVTGSSIGEASRRLEEAGFAVVEVPVFDERLQDGLIVSQDPPAGSTNVGEVRLSVSRRPVVSYLSDMEPVSRENVSQYAVGTASTNGEPYSHALTLGASQYGEATASVEYDLSRDYRRLVGDVGLDDRVSSGTEYKVEIYGDGRQLFSEDLTLGRVKPVDIDVTDVLRLEVSVIRMSGTGAVVFADVRAQGLESEVEATSPSAASSSAPR